MKYLLDTNVISELTRVRPHENVITFVGALDDDRVFLSVLSWAELKRGIALLPPGEKKGRLQAWLNDDLRERFDQRVLPVTAEIGEQWAELTARAQIGGRSLPFFDGFIAATAIVHDLCIVTRNERHFHGLGPRLLNPWV